MGQPAYDYNYTGTAWAQAVRRPAPQPERRVNLRVAPGGKAALSPLRAMMQHGLQILALGVLVGLSVALLFSEARIVELSADIRTAKADLVSAQSQNDYYTTTLNVQSSLNSVEDVAGRLGYTDDPRFVALHRAPWNMPVPITDRFRLTKYDADLTAPDGAWEVGDYDLVYFDAFAPDTQPELWSETLFRRICARLAAGGMLVTYSAKGCVKQALRAAGLEVHRLPGALGKHHMVRAVKPR